MMTRVSIRSMMVASSSLLLLLLLLSVAQQPAKAAASGRLGEELPATAKAVADKSHKLGDEQLGLAVKDFGQHIKRMMEQEMSKLIEDVETSKGRPLEQLERLREANSEAVEDIKTRIELAGDTDGALPQFSLGSSASSFLSSASSRLQSAGSFVGTKMRSLGGYVAQRIPNKLRRLFRWPSFLSFKIRFNKSYESLGEELYRQMLFLRTHVLVGIQRVRFLLRCDKHLLGATQFADWTNQEYQERMNNLEAETESNFEAQTLSSAAKRSLEKLASEHRNAFGQSMADAEHSKQQTFSHLKRTKREAMDEDMDLGNELDEDELMDSEDEEMLDAPSESESPAEADEEEIDFSILDEFSNADPMALDEADKVLDEALTVDQDFVPIDLRQTECIPKPENQDACGACYAHVINAAAMYYNCMALPKRQMRRHNARFTSDCGKYLTPPGVHPVLNGCRGGRLSKAFNFTAMVGAMSFGEYEIDRVSFKAYEDVCAYPRPEPDLRSHTWSTIEVPAYKQSIFANIKLSEVDLHLRTIGPVFLNVRIWKNFKDYSAGIYDGKEDDERTNIHSMLIVGHDRDARGRDYWIVWNSHGVAWGERGFLRIYNESLSYFSSFFAGMVPQQLELA